MCVCVCVCVCVSNPSTRVACDTRSISMRSLPDFDPVFLISDLLPYQG